MPLKTPYPQIALDPDEIAAEVDARFPIVRSENGEASIDGWKITSHDAESGEVSMKRFTMSGFRFVNPNVKTRQCLLCYESPYGQIANLCCKHVEIAECLLAADPIRWGIQTESAVNADLRQEMEAN